MKVRLTLLAFSLIASAQLFADDASSGCGPGWMVTKKTSFSATTTRTTTDSYVRPFAMTSGTSGCSKHTIAANQKTLEFIDINRDQLAMEASFGQGEYLAALGSAMGCGVANIDSFGMVVKENYNQVFTTGDAFAVYTQTQQLIAGDARLADCNART